MVRLGVPGADPSSAAGLRGGGEGVAARRASRAMCSPRSTVSRRSSSVPASAPRAPPCEAVRRLVAGAALPTLVDADGLTALGPAGEAARGDLRAARGAAPVVLTPHEGEFARLAGHPPGQDRIADVRSLAAATGAIVLLKGPTTVVAEPGGEVLLAAAGSPALATAGTGDVLSGVIGAFLARGMPALEAAAVGAHVHGRAAALGPLEGLVAGDLPELVSAVLSEARAAGGAASGRDRPPRCRWLRARTGPPGPRSTSGPSAGTSGSCGRSPPRRPSVPS